MTLRHILRRWLPVGIAALVVQLPAQAALFERAPTDLQAEARAAGAEGRQLAIFLTLPDCPGCLEMERTVHRDSLLEKRFKRRFRTVHIDISRPAPIIDPAGLSVTPADFAKRLRAVATPSFAFFDGKGTVLYRYTGNLDVAGLGALGQFVTSATYEIKPFAPPAAQGVERSLFAGPPAMTLARQPDFSLAATDGRQRRIADFRGVAVALAVGYTQCPDVCPTTLAELQAAVESLPAGQRQQVQVLFATLDPERDSLAILKEYADAFRPKGGRSILGLRGNPTQTAELVRQLQLVADKQPSASMGYTLDHTAGVFLFDARGRLIGLSPYGQPLDKLSRDLASLARTTLTLAQR